MNPTPIMKFAILFSIVSGIVLIVLIWIAFGEVESIRAILESIPVPTAPVISG